MPDSAPADREPARTDSQAKARFLRFLNHSLGTVHGTAIWVVSRVPGTDTHNAFTVPEVLPLATGDERLFLRSTIQFVYSDHPDYPGERKVSTLLYAHTVGATDTLKPQLYSWEWSSAEPTYPHLHVRRGDPAFRGLGKLHVPTGRVFYEHVLLFMVKEHGVQPARDDWQKVLSENFRRVSAYARWGGGIAAAESFLPP